jgi:polyisoprenoid-binding protein YceI
MQKHFNQKKFLDTKSYPDARLVAKITNIDKVDFSKNGSYEAMIEGDMTIRGVTNKIKEKGTITVKGGTIEAKSVFNVTLADYGIEFRRGKPSSNIADTVEVTVLAEYQKE